MPTYYANRAPRTLRNAARTPAPHFDPFYAYGYNPTWPSILSVAHDEADGGALFVITDRPCTLAGPTLPLSVAGKVILAATTVLPIKFRLTMSGAIPRDAAWTWGTGPCQLLDAAAGHHAPNPGSGNCADVPGPYTPPPPANVVGTAYGPSGLNGWAELTFDHPVILNGLPPDSSIVFGGVYSATSVSAIGLHTLRFELPVSLFAGSAWNVNNQPSWIDTPVAWPQSGTF